MVAFSHNQLLDFHVYLILLGWFVRRRREEWWKMPVWERKWRRKDSQGKVGISAHFSGGRCCHARGFNPKPYYSPCAKDLWVKGGLQRPQESKNHGNPFCLSVTNMEAIFAVTNTTSAVNENRTSKNSGLYGIWTYDLCDTVQCSTNWANKPLYWFQINPWNGE